MCIFILKRAKEGTGFVEKAIVRAGNALKAQRIAIEANSWPNSDGVSCMPVSGFGESEVLCEELLQEYR